MYGAVITLGLIAIVALVGCVVLYCIANDLGSDLAMQRGENQRLRNVIAGRLKADAELLGWAERTIGDQTAFGLEAQRDLVERAQATERRARAMLVELEG